MIIKSVRVETSQGIRRLVRHLYEGTENEAIVSIQGTPGDIADMHDDARNAGRMYAVRHWIIAPAEATTEMQFRWVLCELAKEFGFEKERAVVIEHAKPRAMPDAFDRHWHVAVGEIDPISGRVLSSSFDFMRHEKIARKSELAFRQELVPGAHTKAVVREFHATGCNEEANALSKLVVAGPEKPREAFTHAQHQEAKRLGIDLPALRVIVREAWANSNDADSFRRAIAEAGLAVEAGDESDTWIVVSADGEFVGALTRLTRARKAAVLTRMGKPIRAINRHQNVNPIDLATTKQNTAVDVEVALSRMETEARRRLCEIPSIPLDPPKLIEARKADKVAEDRLAAADREQNERAHVLIVLERESPRWWWLPSRRRRWTARRQQALTACEAAEATVDAARFGTLDAHLAVQLQENALRDAHKQAIARAIRQNQEAKETLAMIAQARQLLALEPSFATKGINGLLIAVRKAEDDDAPVAAPEMS